MAFWENLKRTGRNIAQKTGDVVEIQKLNMAISQEKDKIKSLYAEIGEEVYQEFEAGNDLGYTEKCSEIAQYKARIEELQLKQMKLKDTKKCMGCSAEISGDSVFCPKCGAKSV
jgi:Zn finger protein HypA/HybF involved in hydrogenase expression